MLVPRQLVASVRDEGQQDPIITYEGKVLDGRDRQLACSNLQLKPVYKRYTGDDPLGFVIRSNLHRRHLTTSQRGAVAAKLANLEKGDNQHTANAATSQGQAAQMLNVSPDTIQRAKKVIDSGDEELIEAVETGDMSVNAAVNKLEPRPSVSPAEADCRRILAAWYCMTPNTVQTSARHSCLQSTTDHQWCLCTSGDRKVTMGAITGELM